MFKRLVLWLFSFLLSDYNIERKEKLKIFESTTYTFNDVEILYVHLKEENDNKGGINYSIQIIFADGKEVAHEICETLENATKLYEEINKDQVLSLEKYLLERLNHHDYKSYEISKKGRLDFVLIDYYTTIYRNICKRSEFLKIDPEIVKNVNKHIIENNCAWAELDEEIKEAKEKARKEAEKASKQAEKNADEIISNDLMSEK